MPAPHQDYYEILGVKPDAKHEEIQRAYRKLARQYHPDISKAKDAEEKFKKINEAYEVVGDEQKRRKYDDLKASPTPPPGAEQYHYTGAGPEDFSDFFYTYFGRPGGAGDEVPGGGVRRRRGRDLELEVEVTLAEVVRGGQKRVEVELTEPAGDGKPSRQRRTLEIPIPRGVTEGTVIRVAGEGGKGSGGGQPGDLYVMFTLKPDPRFEVKEHDLYSTVDVAPWEAALGAKVKVATVEGSVNMTLPPGTSSGHILRLRGKGLPKPDGTAGDQMVTVRIVVPSTLSESEKRLFAELARESRFHPRP
jgi:curved DNA-binding protein